MDKPTLVIGDVHGHYDRLEELLRHEGIIDSEGNRINHDVEVVQLGDLAHFGKGASPAGDKLCYQKADEWLDVLLWGNHDRAVFDKRHTFVGYRPPDSEVKSIMENLIEKGKMKWAHSAHRFLITHAGLHSKYDIISNSMDFIAELINDSDDYIFEEIRNAVSSQRRGRHDYGGILWRDYKEDILNIPQVFGHTSMPYVRNNDAFCKDYHWCIDVGDAYNGMLADIWLPSQEGTLIRMNEEEIQSGFQV